MVKLKTEQRSHWDKRKITVIETEYGIRCSYIPKEDFEFLMNVYDSFPHPKLQKPNWNFVSDIGNRIYTEWCMNTDRNRHASYEGEGFTDFVIGETHLELIRKGYNWNEQEKKFENLNEQQYQEARQRVLGGLTLRAIELFSDWNRNSYPPARVERTENKTLYIYDDKRNLRDNLESYIRRFESLKEQTQQQAV